MAWASPNETCGRSGSKMLLPVGSRIQAPPSTRSDGRSNSPRVDRCTPTWTPTRSLTLTSARARAATAPSPTTRSVSPASASVVSTSRTAASPPPSGAGSEPRWNRTRPSDSGWNDENRAEGVPRLVERDAVADVARPVGVGAADDDRAGGPARPAQPGQPRQRRGQVRLAQGVGHRGGLAGAQFGHAGRGAGRRGAGDDIGVLDLDDVRLQADRRGQARRVGEHVELEPDRPVPTCDTRTT